MKTSAFYHGEELIYPFLVLSFSSPSSAYTCGVRIKYIRYFDINAPTLKPAHNHLARVSIPQGTSSCAIFSNWALSATDKIIRSQAHNNKHVTDNPTIQFAEKQSRAFNCSTSHCSHFNFPVRHTFGHSFPLS